VTGVRFPVRAAAGGEARTDHDHLKLRDTDPTPRVR
jgi:hypothetical protein